MSDATVLPSIEEVKETLAKKTKYHDRKTYAIQLSKLYKDSGDKFRDLINELCKVC